jgi:monothiol glutaredoxin
MIIMNPPRIVAYLKPACGWSRGVRAILDKYELPYRDLDIAADPVLRDEMILRSGQPLSPCVEINGYMLADVSGAEVEAYLLGQGLVRPTNREAGAPIDSCCSGSGRNSDSAT